MIHKRTPYTWVVTILFGAIYGFFNLLFLYHILAGTGLFAWAFSTRSSTIDLLLMFVIPIGLMDMFLFYLIGLKKEVLIWTHIAFGGSIGARLVLMAWYGSVSLPSLLYIVFLGIIWYTFYNHLVAAAKDKKIRLD